MKILVLYDEKSEHFEGLNLPKKIQELLKTAGHEVDMAQVCGKNIRPCTGCFACWVKTPGLCVLPDDGVNDLNRRYVNSEIIVTISEAFYGCWSADLKKYLDRSIPNVMPYLVSFNGETHHPRRYKYMPMVWALGYGKDLKDSEKQTFMKLVERNCLNTHSKHLALTACNASEACDAFSKMASFFVTNKEASV